MKISFILPAHNEEDIIESSVQKVCSFLEKNKYNFEIIIAEDGSTDRTYEIAKSLVNSKIKLTHSRRKLGKGKAIKNAIRNSKGDIIIFSDADLAAKLEHSEEIIKKINNGCDVCIGSRFLDSKKVVRPLHRKIASSSYNRLVRLIFDTKITDFQCGLKGFHKKTSKILLSAKDNEWF